MNHNKDYKKSVTKTKDGGRSKRIENLKVFSLLPAILLAIMIFGFSGQEGNESAGLSATVAGMVYDVFYRMGVLIAQNREAGIELLQFPIRKLAHMTEYALFTASVFLPVRVYRVRKKWQLPITFMVAVSYAALDEFHQRFVPGRTGCFTDVLIDSIGIFTMTVLLWLLFTRKQKM